MDRLEEYRKRILRAHVALLRDDTKRADLELHGVGGMPWTTSDAVAESNELEREMFDNVYIPQGMVKRAGERLERLRSELDKTRDLAEKRAAALRGCVELIQAACPDSTVWTDEGGLGDQVDAALRERLPMMRVICAWCGTVLREGAEPVSHGICPACEAGFEGEP
jgi:hypothetical protein